MDTIFLIILSAFAVYGIISAIYAFLLLHIPIKDKYLMVHLDCTTEKTEAITRLLIKKYADCEVIILNDSLSEESTDIIKNLSAKYGQLHFADR